VKTTGTSIEHWMDAFDKILETTCEKDITRIFSSFIYFLSCTSTGFVHLEIFSCGF
jgi:hypothetical protein